MAAPNKQGDASVKPAADQPTGDLGKAEVQRQMDRDLEQGFHGVKVDPLPNEAYSLQTGPDSPRAVEDSTSRVAQHAFGADTERKNV